jgi:hypothetical protein
MQIDSKFMQICFTLLVVSRHARLKLWRLLTPRYSSVSCNCLGNGKLKFADAALETVVAVLLPEGTLSVSNADWTAGSINQYKIFAHT